MSDNLAPKFAQLSVRSDKVGEDDSSSAYTRTNGEEEKGKNNPWKLIPSAENNALEADAWPAPSVPTEQRRHSGARQPDEKPKSTVVVFFLLMTASEKIKWQNYEGSSATFAVRGRGGYGSPSFSAPHYTFRRGGCGFRGRGADAVRSRGANGVYTRNPFRVSGVRNPVESREEKSNVVVTTADSETVESHSDANGQKIVPSEQNSEEQIKSGAGDDVSASGSVAQPSSVDSSFVRTVVTQSSQVRRPYRDRMPNPQGMATQSSATGAYEAGPVGRARRCYMRQHQTAYVQETEATSATHSLVPASIQPVVQYQPMAPITYYIPGTPAVGTALWGPNLQLAVSTGSHSTVQTNVAPISVTNTALIPLPNPHPIGPAVGGIDGSHPVLSDLSLTSSTLIPQALPRVPADLPSFKGLNVSEVQVEVVDVDKLVAFVNERQWQNVVFPLSLKEHPAVAASIRAALSNSETNNASEAGVRRSEGSHPPEMSQEETTEKPSGKPDVIIVEGRFFFVPRNVNRTKFLKFVSKSDYIRHHVEYYFSQSNLNRDVHLATILAANQDVCPISELLQFNRLRFVSTTKAELLEAVASSPSVVVTYASDGSPFGIARIMEATTTTTLSDTSVAANNSEQSSTTSTTLSDAAANSSSTMIAVSSSGQTLSNGDVASPHRPHHLPSAALSSYTSSQTTTNSAVQMPSLIATPNHIPAQYMQSQAFVLNSLPRMEFNNTSPASATYPGFTAPQLQQYYPHSDAGVSLPQAASLTFPSHQNLYPHPQALVAAAANQPSLISSNQPNLQSPDGSAAFMTTFYRITSPGHPPPTVGAFLPSVGNTAALAASNNSPVFLQLLPTAHPSSGYLGSNASNPSSVFNRPVWIPVATPGGGIAVSNITPSFPHYITVSHGPPNLTVPNAVATPFSGTVPHPLQAGSLPTIPTALFDVLYTGQNDLNSSNLTQSHMARQNIHSGSHSHTSSVSNTTSSIQPATTSISSSNAHPGSNISRVTATHHALSFAPDSMTLSVSSTGSNQPTPKKVTVNAHP
ncbi:hypothetical protein FGIG_08366 [Fasciola gigantica]|uniref:HTH La-type RNA-binding domain-containing protein n=1 Tax=Fasciola gigantica TaxID=46835 RepID=A0A504Y8P8_FASGI|nr:hypothetical protein FGIG_08366 [Fasciola gigantica]